MFSCDNLAARLPTEILEQMVDFNCSDAATLKSCSLVSKAFNARSRHHNFSEVVVGGEYGADITTFLDFIADGGSTIRDHIQTLQLHLYLSELDVSVIERLSPLSNRLQMLGISVIDDEEDSRHRGNTEENFGRALDILTILLKVAQQFPHLPRLHITVPFAFPNDIISILQCFDSVEELLVTHDVDLYVLDRYQSMNRLLPKASSTQRISVSSLRSVHFDRTTRVRDYFDWFRTVTVPPPIEELSLKDLHLEDDGFQHACSYIVTLSQSLKILTLETKGISLEGLHTTVTAQINGRLSNLEELVLGRFDCRNTPSNWIPEMLRHFSNPNLKRLDLRFGFSRAKDVKTHDWESLMMFCLSFHHALRSLRVDIGFSDYRCPTIDFEKHEKERREAYLWLHGHLMEQLSKIAPQAECLDVVVTPDPMLVYRQMSPDVGAVVVPVVRYRKGMMVAPRDDPQDRGMRTRSHSPSP